MATAWSGPSPNTWVPTSLVTTQRLEIFTLPYIRSCWILTVAISVVLYLSSPNEIASPSIHELIGPSWTTSVSWSCPRHPNRHFVCTVSIQMKYTGAKVTCSLLPHLYWAILVSVIGLFLFLHWHARKHSSRISGSRGAIGSLSWWNHNFVSFSTL